MLVCLYVGESICCLTVTFNNITNDKMVVIFKKEMSEIEIEFFHFYSLLFSFV